jgi:hypothetical protein
MLKIFTFMTGGKPPYRLVDESRSEDQYLDFKQVTKSHHRYDEDKRNLADNWQFCKCGQRRYGLGCRLQKNAEDWT